MLTFISPWLVYNILNNNTCNNHNIRLLSSITISKHYMLNYVIVNILSSKHSGNLNNTTNIILFRLPLTLYNIH